jgi:hypothetical protein
MISKNHTKTSAEKVWLETVIDFSVTTEWLHDKYVLDINFPYNFHIDHVIGSTAKRKINGVSWRVGELAIVPCPIELHDNLYCNHKYHRAKGFRKHYGHEKKVWLEMIRAMQSRGYEIPFSENIIQAIIK